MTTVMEMTITRADVRRQYQRNARQLAAMAEKARLRGEYRGRSSEYYTKKALEFRAKGNI